MLPFLKKKQDSVAGLIIKSRTPDKPNESEELEDYSAEDCAKDLIAAVQANDAAGVVKAIRDIMDSPQDEDTESDAPSPHSYDAQNQLAAQNKDE